MRLSGRWRTIIRALCAARIIGVPIGPNVSKWRNGGRIISTVFVPRTDLLAFANMALRRPLLGRFQTVWFLAKNLKSCRSVHDNFSDVGPARGIC